MINRCMSPYDSMNVTISDCQSAQATHPYDTHQVIKIQAHIHLLGDAELPEHGCVCVPLCNYLQHQVQSASPRIQFLRKKRHGITKTFKHVGFLASQNA